MARRYSHERRRIRMLMTAAMGCATRVSVEGALVADVDVDSAATCLPGAVDVPLGTFPQALSRTTLVMIPALTVPVQDWSMAAFPVPALVLARIGHGTGRRRESEEGRDAGDCHRIFWQ